MAEKSILWTTGSTGDGANPYTQEELFSWLRRTFNKNGYIENGYVPGYGNELMPLAGVGLVNIGSGAAYVYGIPYENTSELEVAIPTPVSDNRVDLIVLRADWTAQTVRITRVEGIEGGGAPSLTQNAGDIWEIMLCQVEIDTGGNITLTDNRIAIRVIGRVGANELENNVIENRHLTTDCVNTENVMDGAITPDKISGGVAVRIAEVALSTDYPTIEIDNIPTSYRHLRLVISGRSANDATAESLGMRFNDDGNLNYNSHRWYSHGTNSSYLAWNGKPEGLSFHIPALQAMAGSFGGGEMVIMDYRGANFKSYRGNSVAVITAGDNGIFNVEFSGAWFSSDPITKITLFSTFGANIIAGTVLTLYGLP